MKQGERRGGERENGKEGEKERDRDRQKDKSLMSSGDMMIIMMKASACTLQWNPRLLPPPPRHKPSCARAWFQTRYLVFSQSI